MPPINARNPRSLVLLAADQITSEGLQWIEVMPTVEKARNGRWYFTVTTEDLETFAQSIRDQPGLIPIDYDHQGVEGSSRAAGWFTGQARVEGDRLLAEVQWTPKAVGEIQAGEYKRISPEFSFQDKDQKTGLMTRAKELLAATLTNRPFFRELAPVGSEVIWDAREGWQQLQQRVNAALNPGGIDSARFWVLDIAQGKALVEEYRAQRTWVVTYEQNDDGSVTVAPEGDWTLAEREWVAASREAIRANTARRPFRQKENDMDTSVIAKTLGLAEDATDAQIEQALASVKANADKLEKENTDLKAAAENHDGAGSETQKLRDELAAERVKRVTGERAAVFATAVREGRMVPAELESLTVAFGGDSPTDEHVATLKTVLDARPKHDRSKEIGTGEPGADDGHEITRARKELAYRSSETGDLTADDDSLELHVRAEKILAEQGKKPGQYTDRDYSEAILQAGRDTAAV